MSIISMPCSAAWAMWASLSRLASRPPCTRGCSVFTRPSIISGNCVTSSMGVTGTPASLSARAVPPVEMISAPNSSTSARAKSATPLLSVTDTSTRLTLGLLIWPYILSSCLRLNGPLRPISCDAWYHPNREVNEEARAYPANAHDEKVSEPRRKAHALSGPGSSRGARALRRCSVGGSARPRARRRWRWPARRASSPRTSGRWGA